MLGFIFPRASNDQSEAMSSNLVLRAFPLLFLNFDGEALGTSLYVMFFQQSRAPKNEHIMRSSIFVPRLHSKHMMTHPWYLLIWYIFSFIYLFNFSKTWILQKNMKHQNYVYILRYLLVSWMSVYSKRHIHRFNWYNVLRLGKLIKNMQVPSFFSVFHLLLIYLI